MKTIFAQNYSTLRMRSWGLRSISKPQKYCVESQTSQGNPNRTPARWWFGSIVRIECTWLKKLRRVCVAITNRWPEPSALKLLKIKMKIFRKYKHLAALLVVLTMAACLVLAGAPLTLGIAIVGLWQLSQFAMSQRMAICYISGLTPEQSAEFQSILLELNAEIPKVKGNSEKISTLEKLYDNMRGEVRSLRKQLAGTNQNGVRVINGVVQVSEDCAKYLGSMFVVKAIQDGKLKGSMAESMLARAAEFLGVETRAAMATTDVPLPVAYGKQIAELVFTYGTARKYCTVYPLSGNSMKLPRLKTGEPQFAFITISGAVPEKVPQSEFITFTPGKAGGIVRIPSEIEEDSIFDLGQFVARYIAREMAYWEAYCLFLGDGTSTYNSISGVWAPATTDSTVLQLSAGNSSSDKITIANVRTLRTKPIAAILRTGMVTSHLVRMLLA